MTHSDMLTHLEAITDQFSAQMVAEALSGICYANSRYFEDDEDMHERWDVAGAAFDDAAMILEQLEI